MSHELKRGLSLTLVTFYGLGTILGAGIYVLTGVVAERAGIHAPLSFGIAALVALFTAISYAELSKRFPKSAGEALYVQEGFKNNYLSMLTGWAVVLVGIVSAATIANGFVGYLDVFIPLNPNMVKTALVLVLGFVAFFGIMESVALAAAFTLLELVGLVLVIGTGFGGMVSSEIVIHSITPPVDIALYVGIFSGAALAFYAFIGFEDIVNVAEEVKKPEINLPKAIYWSIGVSTFLYMLTAVIAVTNVPIDELAGNKAPMALIVEKADGIVSPQVIAFISMLAVINGALVQIIMAARVLYGMGKLKTAPAFMSQVHPKTKTPWIATVLVTALLLVLALAFDLTSLAEATSVVTLLIFMAVNLSLLVIQFREKQKATKLLWPSMGLLTCAGLLFAF